MFHLQKLFLSVHSDAHSIIIWLSAFRSDWRKSTFHSFMQKFYLPNVFNIVSNLKWYDANLHLTISINRNGSKKIAFQKSCRLEDGKEGAWGWPSLHVGE